MKMDLFLPINYKCIVVSFSVCVILQGSTYLSPSACEVIRASKAPVTKSVRSTG